MSRFGPQAEIRRSPDPAEGGGALSSPSEVARPFVPRPNDARRHFHEADKYSSQPVYYVYRLSTAAEENPDDLEIAQSLMTASCRLDTEAAVQEVRDLVVAKPEALEHYLEALIDSGSNPFDLEQTTRTVTLAHELKLGDAVVALLSTRALRCMATSLTKGLADDPRTVVHNFRHVFEGLSRRGLEAAQNQVRDELLHGELVARLPEEVLDLLKEDFVGDFSARPILTTSPQKPLNRTLEVARAAYEARPEDPRTVDPYVMALREAGGPALELAVRVLRDAARSSNNESHLQTAAKIEFAQIEQEIAALRSRLALHPSQAEQLDLALEQRIADLQRMRIAEFERRLAVSPTSAEAHFSVALEYIGCEGKEMLEKAIGHFQKAQKHPRFELPSLYYIAEGFARLGEHETALDAYQKVLNSGDSALAVARLQAIAVHHGLARSYSVLAGMGAEKADEYKAKARHHARQVRIQDANYGEIRSIWAKL